MAENIHSIKDPRVIHARTLVTAHGRLESGDFLLEGMEQIIWGLEANLHIRHVFIWDKFSDHDSLIALLASLNISYFFVSDGILKKITDTSYVIPCIAVTKQPDIKKANIPEMAIVLDNLVDHGNIGTIIRSAAAFGIKTIVSTMPGADFFYKKIIDASRGKVFEAQFTKFSNDRDAIQYLKKQGYQIVATSPHAKTIQSLAVLSNRPVALVLGNETDGCSQHCIDEADLVVQIPMQGTVESLNVAVAAGISMYEIKVKLVIAMLIQKIHKNLGRQFGVTHALIRQALDIELSKITNIGSMQIILLMILKCDQFMSLKQVAQDTEMCCSSTKEFLQPLVVDGYLQLTTYNNLEGITLTKSGEELIAKLWPIIEKTEEKLLHGFSDVEKTQLLEYICRIQDNCSKITHT